MALTIDEEGMAKDVERKLESRTGCMISAAKYGLPPSDLLIDPLTFTICTGNEDDRKLGLWTLEAIERIHAELPDMQIVLGLSNISFGLNPASAPRAEFGVSRSCAKTRHDGRHHPCQQNRPAAQNPRARGEAAEDLIFDRRLPSAQVA